MTPMRNWVATRVRFLLLAIGITVAGTLAPTLLADPVLAQTAQGKKSLPQQVPLPLPGSDEAAASERYLRAESVQADVSTRRVAVTSSFSGQEVVVFGAVDNSRQPNAASGYYDVVVVIEGAKEKLVARKKNRVGGIWINVGSQQFESVPSFYAIASTRPLDEVTSEANLTREAIGFTHIPLKVPQTHNGAATKSEMAGYRKSIVRLKQAAGLYIQAPYNVAFTGNSLFRTTIRLPANVTIGPFATRVYLFREGKLLSKFASKLTLEREGVERIMHGFAFGYPFWYGIFAVFVAVFAGLVASQMFSRKS